MMKYLISAGIIIIIIFIIIKLISKYKERKKWKNECDEIKRKREGYKTQYIDFRKILVEGGYGLNEWGIYKKFRFLDCERYKLLIEPHNKDFPLGSDYIISDKSEVCIYDKRYNGYIFYKPLYNYIYDSKTFDVEIFEDLISSYESIDLSRDVSTNIIYQYYDIYTYPKIEQLKKYLHVIEKINEANSKQYKYTAYIFEDVPFDILQDFYMFLKGNTTDRLEKALN